MAPDLTWEQCNKQLPDCVSDTLFNIDSIIVFQSPEERGVVVQILESGYRFVLGSIGGGTFNVSYRRLTFSLYSQANDLSYFE